MPDLTTQSTPPADPAPVPPDKPDPGDCCGGGCVRCVYDVYEDALERYQAALEAWKERQDNSAMEAAPPYPSVPL